MLLWSRFKDINLNSSLSQYSNLGSWVLYLGSIRGLYERKRASLWLMLFVLLQEICGHIKSQSYIR